MVDPQKDRPQIVWKEASVGAELAKPGTTAGRRQFRALFGRNGLLILVGLVLLTLWGNLWWRSLVKDRLAGPARLAVPRYFFLGVDFLHNYFAARHFLAGGNPYDGNFGAPLEAKFAYPPAVLRLFAWARFVPAEYAVGLWVGILTALAALAVFTAYRSRRALELTPVPFVFLLAAFLWTFPVLFALERGNYDLVVLALIVLAVGGLRQESLIGDLLAGSALALAAWIKVYPGLLWLGLLVLGRYRAFICCSVAGFGIALADHALLAQFLVNVREFAVRDAPSTRNTIDYSVHTLSGCWPLFWNQPRLAWLSRIPPLLGATLVLSPAILWVCWELRRCWNCWGLQFAFLVWLTAAATFIPPVANDYSLVFLPLAALAVWDRRDPVTTHVLMGLALLTWQPFLLSIGPRLFFLFKLCGLAAVGLSLITRAREHRATAGKSLPLPAAGLAQAA